MATELQQSGSRHGALGLSDDDLLSMYRTMVTARLCDEAQFRLNRQGKAPFVVPVSGHEGCQVGTAWAMGWLTLTVGHLNILSATFAVMLIGMGDYGVLWVTRRRPVVRGTVA